MKRFWVEIQIGLLVITGVALVLAMGYLAYTSMSSILSSVTRESKPDVKLNLIQMLATDLEKAGNSVRLYAYSRDENDLKPYFDLLAHADEKITALKEAGMDNPEFTANIDTVNDLLEKKILLWNEMLPLYTIKQAEKYLDTISKELEYKILSDSLRKNRSLIKKIFQRQKKVKLDEAEMVRNIVTAKDEDSLQTNRIRDKELQLAEANSRLTLQFYDLVKRMEESEYRSRKARALEADRMAKETYRWIGWFSLSAALSLMLVIFVITRYTRKSYAYQKALVMARNEAQNLAKAKEMFVANVSHELRTPMNVISGFVDQLLKRPQDEENQDTLKIIKSSSDHLVRIVNDILDFSKLESGKMKLEPVHFNIRDVFGELTLLFRNALREKKIGLSVTVGEEVPVILFGDPIRLKQILINLTGNAIKFTEEGNVTIDVKAENQVAGHLDLKISVSDTGIGIAQDKLEMIFEDFTQAESGTTQRYGGTGLGLSIVKKLVALHQGDVRVTSRINEGTTFTCRLPYRKGKMEEITSKRHLVYKIPEAIMSLRILVVDDEEYNRKLVGSILKKWKIFYDEAESGDKALEILKSGKFDIVLMDNRMPGMDGLETSGIIRKTIEKDHERLAIVSFTAATVSDDIKKKFAKVGISTYLSKPFAGEELLKILLKLRKMKLQDLEALEEDELPAVAESGPAAVDLKQLYRVAGDDESFVNEMLEKFIESFDSGYEKMVNSLHQGATREAGEAAHKLASPCRHIGAEKLVAMLKEIESEAENEGKEQYLKAKADEVGHEYGKVRQLILNHLNDRKN